MWQGVAGCVGIIVGIVSGWSAGCGRVCQGGAQGVAGCVGIIVGIVAGWGRVQRVERRVWAQGVAGWGRVWQGGAWIPREPKSPDSET